MFPFLSYSCGNNDGRPSAAETLESILSLLLGPISMDGCHWEVLAVQEFIQGVSTLLGLHKY